LADPLLWPYPLRVSGVTGKSTSQVH